MAKYKDAATAQADLARKMQEKAAELRPIYDSKDPKEKTEPISLKLRLEKYRIN